MEKRKKNWKTEELLQRRRKKILLVCLMWLVLSKTWRCIFSNLNQQITCDKITDPSHFPFSERKEQNKTKHPPLGPPTMTSPLVLLPSDGISPDYLPVTSSAPLRLGSGVRLLSEQSQPSNQVISATQAGLLSTDPRRNAVSILSFPNHRYIPTPNDLVVAQVHHSSADYFHCMITPQTPHALLAQLAFEGASKKTRPMLKQGDLVYARVLSTGISAGAEVELTCVNPATGKAEPGGLGPLTGGMVFDVSMGLAARLTRASSSKAEHDEGVAGLVVLDELGAKLENLGGFEIAVGRNGKIWVDCSNAGDSAIKATVAVGRCLHAVDEGNLSAGEQRKLVTRTLREMKV